MLLRNLRPFDFFGIPSGAFDLFVALDAFD